MLKGVHAPHRKNTAALAPVVMAPPESVVIPMSMHIGAPSVPVVKPGDRVLVGQKIAEAGGFVGVPVHASISGTVKKIEDILQSNGTTTQAIVIQSDGLMEKDPSISPKDVRDYDGFVQAVLDSGMVGLGGAGFPTHVKFRIKDLSQVEEIVINGAECEPYITSDTRTMIDHDDLLAQGFRLLEKFLGVRKIIIGIEKNKPEAIRRMKAAAAEDIHLSVKVLPALYPQGGEKVLIYHTTGKIVPEGKLPLDVGVIVLNCTTLASIVTYLNTGMPLISKCITVDGSAVKNPQNLVVPIGTRISDVLEACGGFREEPEKILYGGPMMGISVPNTALPVMKNTNAIVALNRKDSQLPKTTACIRCGNCVSHCPMNLNPPKLAQAYKTGNTEMLEKYKVMLCMECGCCSFVCPAHRPLVQQNKLGKALLKNAAAAKKEERK